MRDKLSIELKRFKKQRITAITVVIALVLGLGLVFLCYLQNIQINNIAKNITQDINKIATHVINDKSRYSKILLSSLLQEQLLWEQKANSAAFLQHEYKKIQKQNGHVSDIVLYKNDETFYKSAQQKQYNSLNLNQFYRVENTKELYSFGFDEQDNIVFKLLYPIAFENEKKGYIAVFYDLDWINEAILELTSNKSYFIVQKNPLENIYDFSNYQFITKIDPFLTDFLHSEAVKDICLSKSKNVIYNKDEKSYIATVINPAKNFHLQELRLIVFEDISYLIQSKNYMFWTVILGVSALVLFIVSLFLSYLNDYQRKLQQLFEGFTQKLQQQKKQFESYYKKAPVPVITIAKNRRIEYVNDRFLQLLGYKEREVLQMDLIDFILEADLKVVKARFEQNLAEDETKNFEFRVYNKDANIISVKMSLRMIEPKTQLMQATFLDVSEDIQIRKLLMKNESYLKAVFDAEPEMMIVTDGKEIKNANRAFFEFVGMKDLEEFKQKYQCICDLFIEKKGYLAKYCTNHLWLECLFNDDCNLNKALMYKDSILHTFAVNSQKITANSKEYYVVLFTDITADEEKKLRYEFALEGSNDGIWDIDLISKQVYFSPRWKQMLGYEQQEITNQADEWWDRIHPEDLEEFKLSFDEAIKNKSQKYENIHRLKHKNGQWLWFYAHGKLFYGEDDTALRMVGVHTDITNLKLQQVQLEKLNTVLEYSPFGVMITDIHGVIEYANRYCVELMGYSVDELIGTNIISYSHESQSNQYIQQKIIAKTQKHQLFSGNIEVIKKDGQVYKEHNIIAPVVIDAEIRGYIGIKQEASDVVKLRHQLHEKEELMLAQSRHAAMGEMIGMIAHQWRQPISVIAMSVNNILADIELKTLDEKSLKPALQDIVKQTQHLSHTIDDFRNFFKSNKEKRSFSINESVDETLGIMGKSLENNNIQLKLQLDAKQKLFTYDREILQVLINIIQNAKEAIIASDGDTKEISIQSYDDKEFVVLKICDSGEGIDNEVLPKIFEPYFSTKDEKNGTGLGLYMSQTIIHKHLGGELYAYNKTKTQGACFVLRFPLKKDTNE